MHLLPPTTDARRTKAARAGAFTLLEVVLAISIAIGILVVALTFHQQATVLRGSLIDEAERLAAVRQIMDRLAADLRVAPVHERIGFTGDSNSLRFVSTALPLPGGGVQSDFKRIAYRTTFSGDGTNLAVSGLVRTEEPALELIAPAARASAPASSNDETNAPAESTTSTNAPAATPVSVASEPLTEALRHLRFRFWDGVAWVDSWSGTTPPPGVEVTLGFEPLSADLPPDQYPGEIFQRVIFLPAGQPKPPDPTLVVNAHSR